MRVINLWNLSMLFAMILFLPFSGYTQNLDSLAGEIKSSTEDTAGVNYVNDILKQIGRKKPQFSKQFALENLALAKKLNYKDGIANSYWQIGGIYRVLRESVKAIEYLKASGEMFIELKKISLASAVFNELGIAYRNKADLAGSVASHQKAVDLATSVNDTIAMIRAMNNLGTAYYRSGKLDTASIIKKNALGMAIGVGDVGLQGSLFLNIGNDYLRVSDYDSAILYYQQAVDIRKRQNNQMELSKVLNNLALAYSEKGEYLRSIDINLKTLKIREELNDKRGVAFSYSNIGAIYQSINEPVKALEFHQKATDLFKELNMEYRIGLSLSNLAKSYLSLDSISKSLAYEKQSLSILNKISECNTVDPLFGIAKSFKELHQHDSAKYYYSLTAKLSQKCEMIVFNISAMTVLGQYALEANNRKEAEAILINAREKAIRSGTKANQKEVEKLLYKLYKSIGRYQKSLIHLESYQELSDSLFNQEKARELSIAEAEYEFDKAKQEIIFDQEKETISLNAEKDVLRVSLWLALVGILIFSVLLFLVFKAYKSKSQMSTKLGESNGLLSNANDKLQQLDQFKTRLFANINHDFRTPLTLIRGYATGISENNDNYLTAKSLNDLENLKQNASTLTEMTNEIQDLLLLEESKLVLKYNEVEIVSYLKRQVKMFSSMAELAAIDLSFQTTINNQLNVHLDRKHFDKILYNLISNAFRYTAKGGNILISLKEDNSLMIINIKDSGKGIDQKDLPHIFDRFYQSPLNEYRSKEGFGIGLAVVKELVQLHNGEISVSSEPGVGTDFEIRLPFNLDKKISEHASVTNSESVKTLPVKKATPTMLSTNDGDQQTILIVDDHEEIRSYITSVVSAHYNTREASNGKEALKLLQKNHIDLILTDLMMPWLDGYDFIQQLQLDERLNKIPVMVVSARTTEDDKHRVLDAGVNEFISKPFDPQELQKRIQNLLKDTEKRINSWDHVVGEQDTHSKVEQNIAKKLNQIILLHISDPSLNTDMIANELSASRSKAIRLIKSLTGQTPLNYIREIRLNYVEDLIKSGEIRTATEATNAIGMKNVTYFIKQYKAHFGKKPEFFKD